MNFVLLGCHCVLASCHSSACASWMSVFICVSGQQHTLKLWAGLAYATSSFPVVLVPCYFPGHIGLIFDLLPGGANGCDPLLWPALLPTLSSSENSQVLPFLCSPAPFDRVLSVHCSFTSCHCVSYCSDSLAALLHPDWILCEASAIRT